MIQRKLFLLFLVLVGSVYWDLYSGKSNRDTKMRHRYTPKKEVNGRKDRNNKVRSQRITGIIKESCSCRECVGVGTCGFLGFIGGCALEANFSVDVPADPREKRATIAIPIALTSLGAAIGTYLFGEKKKKRA